MLVNEKYYNPQGKTLKEVGRDLAKASTKGDGKNLVIVLSAVEEKFLGGPLAGRALVDIIGNVVTLDGGNPVDLHGRYQDQVLRT